MILSGSLGNGIGKGEDVKFLRLVGERGEVYFELNPQKEGYIYLVKDSQMDPLFRVHKGHPEIIETILLGNFMERPIGGITGQEAVLILQILELMRSRAERARFRMSEYTIGEMLEDINKAATAA